MAGQHDEHEKFLILIPVYEDWKALELLLPLLDQELTAHALKADILVVDDGSSEFKFLPEKQRCFRSVETIDILPLRRNVGHQRAIAVGLSYLEANRPSYSVVVMDCDGEDNTRGPIGKPSETEDEAEHEAIHAWNRFVDKRSGR